MTAFSKLHNLLRLAPRAVKPNNIVVRNSHAPTFGIRSSSLSMRVVLDMMHFYTLGGILVFGGFCWMLNLLYGRCELTEIPEGYEPRFWEYEQMPIQQLFLKWVGLSDVKKFEQEFAHFALLDRKYKWRLEEERVHHLMFERGDYKAWYYIPYGSKWARHSAYHTEKALSNDSVFHQVQRIQYD